MDLRPHWSVLVAPVTAAVAVAAATIVAIIYESPTTDSMLFIVLRWVTAAVALALLLRYPVPRALSWAGAHLIVTTRRVVRREGLIRQTTMEIPLQNISDVRVRQNLFQRLIGTGDLLVESTGEHGQETFASVRRPERLQRILAEVGEANALRLREPLAPRPAASVGATAVFGAGSLPGVPDRRGSVAEELERLDALRQRGIISDEEFLRQKARLLGP